MSNDFNGVLLYPHINLNDTLLVKESLLFYDNIYRIVPQSHHPDDSKSIRKFIDDYGIIKNLDPKPYSKEASRSFQTKIEDYSRAAGFKYGTDGPEYDRLHKDKVYDELRRELISKNILTYNGDWLEGNPALITQYMMYLALEISTKNKLSLTTNSIPAFTSSEYLNYDGNYTDRGTEHTHKQVGFYLKNYLPTNLVEIDFKSIMEFRDNYRDERKNFMSSYMKYHDTLTNINDKKIRADAILDHQENLIRSINEFKQACDYLKVKSFCSYKVVTIPVVVDVISKVITTNPTVETQLLEAGITLGILWTLYSGYHEYEEIKKKNPNSYLVTLKNYQFTSNVDVHHCLRNNIHEYWED
jgi:hypothetical protein